MNRRGFSLLEVMIVVAMAMVLAAMLVPMAGNVMERAHLSRCVANLKGIGNAVHLYAADNQMNLPPSTSGELWFNLNSSWLRQYGSVNGEESVRRLLRCPSDKTGAPITDYKYYYSYTYNVEQLLAYVDGAPAHGRLPIKLADVGDRILFGDGISHAESPGTVSKYPASLTRKNGMERISQRHGGGANCLFGDGHVQWMLPKDASNPKLLERADGS